MGFNRVIIKMNHQQRALGLLTFLMLCMASVVTAGELNIMSFNIRFDKGTDGTNNWSYAPNPRKEKVYTTINNTNPDIFGVQEAFDNQVAELGVEFSNYFYIGEQASINPSTMPGEHAGIFFRSNRFTLLEEGTFWYSTTPDSPGTFFNEAAGSSSTRSASWAKVYDQQENRTIAVLNNHWYSGNSADRVASRLLSASLVRQKVKSLLGNLPLILMGDFNNKEESTNEINELQGFNDPAGFQLIDSYKQTHTLNSAIDGTTHSWSGDIDRSRKDLIFHTNSYTTTAAAIDHTTFGNGANLSYPSDHYPVSATLAFKNLQSVLPTAETTPSNDGNDSVDDPAIWIDSNNPSNSFIIGADKSNNGSSGGRLELYNIINGFGAANTSLFATIGSGRYNNVDLRYGFDLDGESVDLVVASNRTTEELAIFKVDSANRTLIDVTGATSAGIDPYGLTMHQAASGALYAFASDRDGNEVRQYELTGNGLGDVDATLVRTITMNGLVEGMVVDDQNEMLYIGEEDTGIFRFNSDPSGGNTNAASGTVVDLIGNGNVVADIEGLAIYDNGSGGGYLIASSQGDSTFAIYSRTGTNELLAQFEVDDNSALGIDGVSNTDGIEVTSAPLGTVFPQGFMIVMDDGNTGAGSGNDNFKLIPWESIAAIIPGTLAGDFNNDGIVDAADYTVWRDNLGNTNESTLNGNGDGINGVGQGDYVLWKSNFGNTTSGSTSGNSSSVPEPTAVVLFVLVIFLVTVLVRPFYRFRAHE